jgi:hypothetical protein
MFNTLNAQQQPFIQSGYGAMSRLNTLLGLGNGGNGAGGAPSAMPRPNAGYAPTPNGGMHQIVASPSPDAAGMQPQGMPQGMPSMPQNMRLKQILALRAQNGDTEAQRILGGL